MSNVLAAAERVRDVPGSFNVQDAASLTALTDICTGITVQTVDISGAGVAGSVRIVSSARRQSTVEDLVAVRRDALA